MFLIYSIIRLITINALIVLELIESIISKYQKYDHIY